MPSAGFPHSENRSDRAHQVLQDINLMNRLVDERASAFDFPTALNGPRIILIASEPFHVRVSLKQLAQTPRAQSALQEYGGIIKAVLANDAEGDAGRTGQTCLHSGNVRFLVPVLVPLAWAERTLPARHL